MLPEINAPYGEDSRYREWNGGDWVPLYGPETPGSRRRGTPEKNESSCISFIYPMQAGFI